MMKLPPVPPGEQAVVESWGEPMLCPSSWASVTCVTANATTESKFNVVTQAVLNLQKKKTILRDRQNTVSNVVCDSSPKVH
jgi:hypothetical protein